VIITDKKHSYTKKNYKTFYTTSNFSARNVVIFWKKASLANKSERTSAFLMACIQNFYGKRNAKFTEKKKTLPLREIIIFYSYRNFTLTYLKGKGHPATGRGGPRGSG